MPKYVAVINLADWMITIPHTPYPMYLTHLSRSFSDENITSYSHKITINTDMISNSGNTNLSTTSYTNFLVPSSLSDQATSPYSLLRSS